MKWLNKTYYIIEFIIFYLIKLVQANIFIAYDILTPRLKTNPQSIQIPITIKSNLGLLLFSNLLSMTPGSLTLDISQDKKYIQIHILYANHKEEVTKEMELIQEKIKNILY